MFQLLGSTWELGDALFRLLEAFLCALFGKNYEEINILRKDTYEKRNKIQDLALLPPCQQTLKLLSKGKLRRKGVAVLFRGND